jgi:hypothetical protein
VENGTVFHYSTHAVVLNYRMEAGSLIESYKKAKTKKQGYNLGEKLHFSFVLFNLKKP